MKITFDTYRTIMQALTDAQEDIIRTERFYRENKEEALFDLNGDYRKNKREKLIAAHDELRRLKREGFVEGY